MKNELKQALAIDMNIINFVDESDCDFNQRLIYSAGAAWAKTLVYGHSYSDMNVDYDFVNTDRLYIQSYLTKILNVYLKNFAVNYDWLNSKQSVEEQASDLASQIIKDVIYTFNLAEILSRRITPVKAQFYKYDKNLLVRGDVPMSKKIYSVGVAQWILDSNILEYKKDKRIVDIKGENYYGAIESDFHWRCDSNLTSNYMMFEVGSKGGYSKCWKPVGIKNIPAKIVMLKLVDEFNSGYILARKRNGVVEWAALDPWYITENEIYRILYALNFHNKTPAEFRAKKHTDFYELQFASVLPRYEDRIITCCSWPNDVYNNKYARIIPNYLWNIVENELDFLGIIIKYR